MLRPLKLLHKLPAFICPRCQKFTGPRYASGMTPPSSHYSTVEHSAREHSQAGIPQHQGRRRPSSKLADQIRPVSDMLLRSLAKRHAESFTVPGTYSYTVLLCVSLDFKEQIESLGV